MVVRFILTVLSPDVVLAAEIAMFELVNTLPALLIFTSPIPCEISPQLTRVLTVLSPDVVLAAEVAMFELVNTPLALLEISPRLTPVFDLAVLRNHCRFDVPVDLRFFPLGRPIAVYHWLSNSVDCKTM